MFCMLKRNHWSHTYGVADVKWLQRTQQIVNINGMPSLSPSFVWKSSRTYFKNLQDNSWQWNYIQAGGAASMSRLLLQLSSQMIFVLMSHSTIQWIMTIWAHHFLLKKKLNMALIAESKIRLFFISKTLYFPTQHFSQLPPTSHFPFLGQWIVVAMPRIMQTLNCVARMSSCGAFLDCDAPAHSGCHAPQDHHGTDSFRGVTLPRCNVSPLFARDTTFLHMVRMM